MNDDLTQLNGRTVPTSTPAEPDIPAERNEALDLTQAAAHVPPSESAVQQATRVYIPPPLPKKDWLPANPPVSASAPRSANQTATPGYLYVLIALGVVGLALVFSLGAFLLHRSVDSSTVALAQNPGTETSQTAATASVEPITATPIPSLTPTPGVAIQPWDGKQRFTMLLMGIDKRPGESGTAFRTDTLMIISLDPVTHSIGMLSVPRDLFVTIPPNTIVGSGYGLQRINSAYTIGELARPGSGAQLAMQTVQYNIGIRINDYVVVEFGTVIAAVDAVGGVDIDVPTPISDPQYPDMNYGYSPLYIPAGHIHMDGQLALKFARSRHESSDLDRAKRQQEVITAIRDKVLSVNMAPQLLTQAPALWAQLSSGVHTDLTLDQLIQLGLYAKDVPKANVHQGVIDYSNVTAQVWQGMDILVPNRVTIGPLMVKVFGANYNG